MSDAPRDQNFVPTALGESSTTPGLTLPFLIDEVTGRLLCDVGGGGSGTVTSVSVVSANGFAGTVATATTTPAVTLTTTITGILKGNGTAISAVTIGSGLSYDGTTLSASSGGGNVSNTGTPLNNQIAIWTDATTIEGDAALTFDTSVDTLTVGAGAGIVKTNAVQSYGTGGLILESANGTDVGLLGAANTANVEWYGAHNFSSATQDTIAAFTGAGKTLGSLALATYPSLTELSYVKGVTSAIQTQLNAKQATITFGTGVETALGVNIGTAGAFVVNGGALGTPSSGTVTNLTGTASININGTVGATTPTTGVFTTLVAGSTTSLLLGTAGSAVGNIGFRNATSGTITLAPVTGALGTVTLSLPAATDTLVGRATTDTFTNKRVQPRTASSTTASNLSPDLATANVYYRTTQTATLTIDAPTGTPVIGETIMIYVDSAGAQTLTINATYIPFGAAFPATTTAGKTFMMSAQYNGTNWKTLWANAV